MLAKMQSKRTRPQDAVGYFHEEGAALAWLMNQSQARIDNIGRA